MTNFGAILARSAAVIVLAAAVSGCSTFARSTAPGSRSGVARPHRAGSVERTVSRGNTAAGHYLKAVVAHNNGEEALALAEMRAAAALDPRQPKIRQRLVQLYVKEGNLNAAVDQAFLLIELEPDDPGHRLVVGDLLAALGRTEEAIEAYDDVLSSAPNNVEVLVKQGALYTSEKQYERGVEVLSRAAAINPASFIVQFYLGRAYALDGDYEAALHAYRAAAELNPSSHKVHWQMGLVHEQRGSKDLAISNYKEALEHNPHFLPARRRLGEIYVSELGARPKNELVRFYLAVTYHELGDLRSAERELRRIPPDSNRYLEARLHLGQLLFETGRTEDSIDAVQELLDEEPNNPQALRYMIELYEVDGQYENALRMSRRLVELDPQNDEYLYRLAWAYDKAGDRASAIRILQKVIVINPENARALNFLGYNYAERGEKLDEAEDLIQRALDLQPNDGYYLDSLGWVFYQRGEYERAVEKLEKAVHLAGNDPVIGEHLADAYVEVGRTTDAIRVYRDCEARTEDDDQRSRVADKLMQLEGRAKSETPGI
jgi:tetratricopeptide (TPR) repeat protein